jgi:putative two-component system response regulator
MTVTPRILLIDDEPNIRESIGAYLEDNDYEILEAASGREGVDLFLEKNPDCVLVDLRMPGMGGLEVLAELTEKSPETPILVVSGTGVIQDAVGALRLGAWDFVTKPIVDMDILGHAVAKAMERAELLRENRLHKEFLEQEVERRI